MDIPTVTESDLLQYHVSHFGVPFPHDKLMVQAYAEPAPTMAVCEYLEDEEDGLGYYPDGVKRTLTAEQIAMFRHSEIQSLLRERRLAAEAQADPVGTDATRHGPEVRSQPSPPAESSRSVRLDDGQGSGPEDGEEEDAEEQEYARFLAAERKEFQVAAAQRRNGEKGRGTYEDDDRTISTRRRVREMDTARTSEDVTMLMYDDEPSEPTKPAKMDKAEMQKAAGEGRKIWFPMIG